MSDEALKLDGESKNLTKLLQELKEQMEAEEALSCIIDEAQSSVAKSLKNSILDAYKHKLNILSLNDKVMELKVLGLTHVYERTLSEDTSKDLGNAYFTARGLVYTLRKNTDLLVDVVVHAGKYFRGSHEVCEHMLESITQFFFCDFGDNAQGDYCTFLRKLFELCKNRDPIKVIETDPLAKWFIKNMLRKECTKYFRGIFKETKKILSELENIEREVDVVIPRSTIHLLSKSVSTDANDLDSTYSYSSESFKGSTAGNKKNFAKTEAGFPLEPSSDVSSKRRKHEQISINAAKELWKTMQELVEYISLSLRAVLSALANASISKNQEETTRKMICNILVDNLLASALNDPMQYDLTTTCILPQSYYETTNNICKILRGIFLNRTILPHESIGRHANPFIKSSQKKVIQYIEALCRPPLLETDTLSHNIIEVKAACLSLQDLNWIFDILIHDYAYYVRNYNSMKAFISRKSRFVYSAKTDAILKGENVVKGRTTYYPFVNVEIKSPFKFIPKDKVSKALKSFLLGVDPSILLSKVADLKEFFSKVEERTELFIKDKNEVTSVNMDAGYLLKAVEDNTLTQDEIVKFLAITKAENEERKSKVAEFSLMLETTLKKVSNSIMDLKKNDHSELLETYISLYASNFIMEYSCPFIVVPDEADVDKCKLAFPAKTTPGVRSKISEFIDALLSREVGCLIVSQSDTFGLGSIYSSYMNKLYTKLEEELSTVTLLDSESKLQVYHRIESYINQTIYEKVFPVVPSEADQLLYNRCKALRWINPEQLEIVGQDLSFGPLKAAINALRSINTYKSPMEKLAALEKSMAILTAGYSKFRDQKKSKEEAPAASELEPRFFYAFIKSTPQMMHSNLNYINTFALQKTGLQECFCALLMKTMCFVEEELTAESLEMRPEEFERRMHEYMQRTQSSIVIIKNVKQDYAGMI